MASVKLEKIFLGTSDSLPIVNILHLSDLHFGIEKAEKSKYRWRPTSKEHWDMLHTLIETLLDRNLVPNEWQPDILAISGDIAWSGQEEEYAEFQKFLDKLLPVLRNNPEKKVLICPGNHDIIRDRVYNKHTGMISRPTKNKPTFTENPDIQIPEITYEAVVEERF